MLITLLITLLKNIEPVDNPVDNFSWECKRGAITTDTAVAAMHAYSAMLGIPIVEPGLETAASVAAVIAEAARMAVVNQQREQAAQMWDGGFTGDGEKYEKKN